MPCIADQARLSPSLRILLATQLDAAMLLQHSDEGRLLYLPQEPAQQCAALSLRLNETKHTLTRHLRPMRPAALRFAACGHCRASLRARISLLCGQGICIVYRLHTVDACTQRDRRPPATISYKPHIDKRHFLLINLPCASRHQLRSSTAGSMATEDTEAFLRVAIQAARAAGQLIEQAFTKDKNVEFKGTMDLVTATDKECEQTILSAITTAFPEHKFIGEEGSAAQGFTSNLTDAPTW